MMSRLSFLSLPGLRPHAGHAGLHASSWQYTSLSSLADIHATAVVFVHVASRTTVSAAATLQHSD